MASKYWCFTINNYTEEEWTNICSLGEEQKVSYIICGRETGAEGTPHLQGYVEFTGRKRLNPVKAIIGNRAHLERRRGTSQEAADYCRKEEGVTVHEYGILSTSSQGRRTDLEQVASAIRAGSTKRELYKDYPVQMMKYGNGILEVWKQLQPRREFITFDLSTFPWHPLNSPANKSLHVWGPSGIGKTSYFRSLYPGALMVSHMDDLGRFDSTEHDAIIFDDMDFKHMPRTAQIHIVDQDDDRSIHIRYATAFIPMRTIKVFLSNNEDIFLDDPAINRRCHKIHLINLQVQT